MKDPVAVPASVLDFCQKAAARWNLDLQSLADQKKIAQNILKLSDFFIDSPEDPTPWHEIWAQQAYVFYFLPLNSIRLSRVFSHLDLAKVPFAQVYDFGAGDLLELKGAGRRPALIPFSEAAVLEIDLEAGRILIDPMAAGLIDNPDDKDETGVPPFGKK